MTSTEAIDLDHIQSVLSQARAGLEDAAEFAESFGHERRVAAYRRRVDMINTVPERKASTITDTRLRLYERMLQEMGDLLDPLLNDEDVRISNLAFKAMRHLDKNLLPPIHEEMGARRLQPFKQAGK